jgi:hypothetical protein
MNPAVEEPRDHRFTIGLVAGTLLGAGLALWLGPGVTAGFRRRTTQLARQLDQMAGNEPCTDGVRPARSAPQAL